MESRDIIGVGPLIVDCSKCGEMRCGCVYADHYPIQMRSVEFGVMGLDGTLIRLCD